MSVYGWCADGFHEGGEYRYGTSCPGRTGDGKACECRCHTGQTGVEQGKIGRAEQVRQHPSGSDPQSLSTNERG